GRGGRLGAGGALHRGLVRLGRPGGGVAIRRPGGKEGGAEAQKPLYAAGAQSLC
ncbi:hypothetical protein HMPREF0731_4723, partial [Pseudoroseomonas cervicalis ATCC 49957]